MTRDDVVRSTATHIRRVGDLMAQAMNHLAIRSVNHDASKWCDTEWPAFAQQTPILAGLTYGSEEYKAACKELGPALEHHYAVNLHHPECHKGGINDMSLMDLLEMLCDWKAATERHKDGSIGRSLLHNRERFKIGDQLAGILLRTAAQLGMVPIRIRSHEGLEGEAFVVGYRESAGCSWLVRMKAQPRDFWAFDHEIEWPTLA